MNKEELIHMHTFMVLMKDFFEKKGKGEFSKYYSLQISPLHVHRHKNEHKNAIFTLGKEILSAIRDDDDLNMTVYDPNNIIKYEKIGDICDDDDSNMTIYDPNNIIKYEKIEIKK